jgi:hypothetical protein
MDATRKGQTFDYNALPDIPGFAPIPVPAANVRSPTTSTVKSVPANAQTRPVQHIQQRTTAIGPSATCSSSFLTCLA